MPLTQNRIDNVLLTAAAVCVLAVLTCAWRSAQSLYWLIITLWSWGRA